VHGPSTTDQGCLSSRLLVVELVVATGLMVVDVELVVVVAVVVVAGNVVAAAELMQSLQPWP